MKKILCYLSGVAKAFTMLNLLGFCSGYQISGGGGVDIVAVLFLSIKLFNYFRSPLFFFFKFSELIEYRYQHSVLCNTGPWRWFDENMLDCCEPLDKVKDEGITFGKVVCLAHCAGAKVQAFRTTQSTIDDFRKYVMTCTSSDDCHVISSYHRGVFDQVDTLFTVVFFKFLKAIVWF